MTAPGQRGRSGDRSLLGLIAFVVIIGVCVGGATASSIIDYVTGEHGTVTVTACIRDNGPGKAKYDCTGKYASSDGGTVLDGVTFQDSVHQDFGERIPATRNGSTAADVNITSYAGVATGTIVFTLCLVGVVLLLVLRARRKSRAAR